VPIAFAEALPIAVLGLVVNVASVWLLGGGHDHGHGHSHGHHDHGHHEHGHAHDAEEKRVRIDDRILAIEIFEKDHPPVFRLRAAEGRLPPATEVLAEVVRAGGAHETYAFEARAGFLQSVGEIPEPHAFSVDLSVGAARGTVTFEEHEHGAHGGEVHRDNNMRAAIVHVLADAAVSVLVIAGLLLARVFGWTWTDPLAGIVGAVVIAAWSWTLVRVTGSILLDMNPDRTLTQRVRAAIEEDGDRVADLHVWRLGPGHLSAIVSVRTAQTRDCAFYRAKLARFSSLSHVTVEVQPARATP
jgi:cation diffusion facilitator family transporter